MAKRETMKDRVRRLTMPEGFAAMTPGELLASVSPDKSGITDQALIARGIGAKELHAEVQAKLLAELHSDADTDLQRMVSKVKLRPKVNKAVSYRTDMRFVYAMTILSKLTGEKKEAIYRRMEGIFFTIDPEAKEVISWVERQNLDEVESMIERIVELHRR